LAKIYTNENFPFPIVLELRRLGHDVLTSRDAGNDGRSVPDGEVLDYAMSSGRVLLSLNRWDFKPLHKATPNHCGMLLCSVDADFSAQAAKIHASLLSNPEMNGVLLNITRT